MSVKLNESQIKYLGINKKNDLTYNLEINGTTHTNGRIYSDEWIQFNETAKGLYWPNGNEAHLYPNNVGSYGSLIVTGTRGGYNGILLGDTQDYMVVMSSPEHQGLFNQANGKWVVYYNKANGLIGIGTADLKGYSNTISGSTYITGSTYINSKLTTTDQVTIYQFTNPTLGVDSNLKIGRDKRNLHINVYNGSGTGINDGTSGGITFGYDDSAVAGIYYQTSGSYGTKLIFGTTGLYADGAYARMIIDHLGNVGIGTLTPSYKLHVVGDVKANNFIGLATHATNDSDGYAINTTYLKRSGGIMTGDISFSNIASWPTVSGETYPINSQGLYWSGSSDLATIFYRVTGSDKGHLVLQLGDDTDGTVIIENMAGVNYATIGYGGITATNFYGTATHATNDATGNNIASSYLRRLDWWVDGTSHDADTLNAGITFAYSSHNTPTTGIIAAFDCRDLPGYTLQLMGSYGGNYLYYRHKNGDNGTWGSWRTILDNNNYASYLDGRYINAGGDTMSGALHFANGTWNNMGDDAAIGDSNVAGAICIKGLNSTTKLHFVPYSGSTAQAISINGNGTMTVTGNLAAEGKFVGKVDLASNRLQDSASGYHQIFINSATSWMTAFTNLVYQAYKWSDIVVSGYIYGSNYWYSPAAVLTDSSTADSIPVYFGYTSAWNLWVAIPARDYYGIEIVDCVSGYAGFDSWQNLFTISHVSSLSGSIQATITAHRPWHRGEQLTSEGVVQINANSRYVLVGPQNSTYCHYDTNADAGHWFNKSVYVNGNIYAGSNYSSLVLHSGNYSSYALPISGGTLTGTLYFADNIGISASMGGGTDRWYLVGSGSDDAGHCQLIIADNATTDYFDLIFRDYTGTDYVAMTACGASVTFGVRTKFNDWIQFNGVYGISWPNSADFQILPNNVSTYGGARIRGGKGGYHGIICGDSTIHMNIMSSDEHQGLYNESNGRWIVYYNRPNNIIALGGSSSWGYTVNVNGSLYASSSAYIADALGSGTRIYTGYDSGITGSVSCSNWFRSSGDTGWFNASYGGGWYQTDSTYIRTYGTFQVYSPGRFLAGDTPSSWYDGLKNRAAYRINACYDSDSYHPWIQQTNSSSGYCFSLGMLGTSFYMIGCPTSQTTNGYSAGLVFNVANGYLTGPSRVYGAVWNDYAEYRSQTEELKPGQVAYCGNDGKLKQTTERLQKFEGVVSDTFGFAIGETENCKTPLAVSGRVLVYTYEDRSTFNSGDCVCAAPNGQVSKMTREEIAYYPDRIVGVVSEIPDYEVWGTGNVNVDNRIWIKVK